MKRLLAIVLLAILVVAAAAPALRAADAERVLLERALDASSDVMDAAAFTVESTAGGGALRLESTAAKAVYRLAETPLSGPLFPEGGATITFRLRVKTEKLAGRVYQEMLLTFPGKGEFFSRGLAAPMTGTSDWKELSIPFQLKAGENPAKLACNLVVEGAGAIWIDQLRVTAAPSKP